MRKLLYHRDLDDSPGTYWTDYAVGIIMVPLCLYLIFKICKSKTKNFSLRWSREENPEATLLSCSVVIYCMSMAIMAVLAGIAHQTLQLAEDYNTWTDDWTYLIIWKIGVAFLSPTIFSMLCMADMIIAQETDIRVPLVIRKIYYFCSAILAIAVLIFNFIHMFTSQDPFTLAKFFYVFFVVMAVNVFAFLFVLLDRLCKSSSPECKMTDSVKARGVLKMAASRCNRICVRTKDNDSVQSSKGVTSDLILYVLAPSIVIIGGVVNFVLRSPCSDSHDARNEKGCPLPNDFNHNALFHVIYTTGLVVLIIAEVLAMRRRRKENLKPRNTSRDEENQSNTLVPPQQIV